MKAHEVLKRYADGRRDFSGENLRGRSFKGKDLSGANFSEADIRGANFTNATLTGANFKGAKAGLQRRWATGLVIGLWILSGLSGIYALLFGALISEWSNSFQLIIISCVALIVFAVSWLVNIRKGLVLGLRPLDRVRPGTTYLQFPKLQQLLITGQGQSQNFDRQNLRGVNLQGANLADASFIGADLNEANLQDADLSRAKLVQTQLDEADLTGATLTGAYIEDWVITSHTKLHGVRCEYVFMRLPTKEDPNPRRKPDNWNETFKDGDFADFIKPIVDTLDLYHNQDVDPRAIAISFKQLAENHPEAELEIVAMEKRGGDKFLLRAATAPEANHSELNAEYFDTYNKVKALAEREIKALIEEKDSRISSLENMIATALQRSSFYAETYQHQGDFMPEHNTKSGDVNISGGNFAAVGSFSGDNPGTVSGTQNIYQSEQQQTLAEAAAEIQQLLKQLEQTNPTATEVEQKAFLTAVIPATKRQRFVNALQEGGKELFKELMDNIYLNVAIAAIEGWQSAE